jgi:hypothetical protein
MYAETESSHVLNKFLSLVPRFKASCLFQQSSMDSMKDKLDRLLAGEMDKVL